ncbi:hypothetical protein [Pararhizobium polonicum]|uniref:hypothetical protein n=1 Tax=Pararhizobium polonicum TaxID=1612624 RepID=UPI001111B9B6|nr:hypothetical protein [Pararhizobium polonicum]
MPYQSVNLEFEPIPQNGRRRSQVFVQSKDAITTPLGKQSSPPDRDRQSHFEQQLCRIAAYLHASELPIFIRWRGGILTRMDKGCIGHAEAAGFLTPNWNDGTLVSVTLSQ